MRILAVLVIVGACGRIDFPQLIPRDGAPVEIDGSVDAPPDATSLEVIGCSDGEREGYVDPATYPTIAACSATWTTELDLRAAPTGGVCGDDAGPCVVPADACALGWHICASSGDVSELLVLSAQDCIGLTGRYVVAAGHCESGSPCVYPEPGTFECLAGSDVNCTQPICCGTVCNTANLCQDAVWVGETHENAPNGLGCANTSGTTQDGVLCCKG